MHDKNEVRQAVLRSRTSEAELHINFWPQLDQVEIYKNGKRSYVAKATDFIAELSKLGFAVPLRGPEAKLVGCEAQSGAENESLSGVTLEEYTKWANSIDASRQDAEITDNDSDYRNTE